MDKINIPYEFITDYDQDNLSEVKDKFYNTDRDSYYRDVKPYEILFGHIDYKPLSDAEISCTMKHILAIKKLSEECNIGLILEDDAIPYDGNFLINANLDIGETPNGWSSIFIGNGCGDNFIKSKSKSKVSETIYEVNHPATNCAEAYILNKESAKKIYDNILPFQQISDWALSCIFYKLNMKIYWRIPSLLYQGSVSGKFKSTLR
jgi:GR25 family glycosyltransferase involved in LPS biosynthesis